jgi:hypothetical protein
MGSGQNASLLTNPLDDDPCPIATFARIIAVLAGRFVYLLPGSPAFRADVIGGARRSGLRIIIGCVLSAWILRLHGRHPVLPTKSNITRPPKQRVDLTQNS